MRVVVREQAALPRQIGDLIKRRAQSCIVFIGRGNPKAHAMRRHLWAVSRTVLPMKHVFDFNQALMDFGATLCTARKPQCGRCPLRRGCASYPFDGG